MTNKKIIISFVFLIFLPFQVFGAVGDMCKMNNGRCATTADLGKKTCNDDEHEGGSVDCGTGYTCCIKDADSNNKCCVLTRDVSDSKYGKSENCPDMVDGVCKIGIPSVNCSSLEACTKNNDSSDKCCVKSDKSEDFGPTNCSTQITSCTGDVKAGKCDTLSQCKSGGGSSTPTTGSVSVSFPNPLQFNTLEEVLNSLLTNLKAIVATIALIFIVLGGLMYITSAGNPGKMKTATSMVTGALIGLAIVIAAPTFLREVKIILGAGDTGEGLRLIDIAKNVLVLLLSLLGIVAIIAMVIGGMMYLTAYGDPKKMESGKDTAKWAVVGISVALSGVIFIRQVAELLQ